MAAATQLVSGLTELRSTNDNKTYSNALRHRNIPNSSDGYSASANVKMVPEDKRAVCVELRGSSRVYMDSKDGGFIADEDSLNLTGNSSGDARDDCMPGDETAEPTTSLEHAPLLANNADVDYASQAPKIAIASSKRQRQRAEGGNATQKSVKATADDKISGLIHHSAQSSAKDDADLNESTFSIFIQIVFPYIVAGFGMVGAGIVLDVVQHWPVFNDITELFVVVPALLGLKGNLEMTLASRLSTAANCGEFRGDNAIRIIGANLALIQSQAVVVGFLASLFAVILGALKYGHVSPSHTLIICGASCATASLASLLLGVIMSGVIFWCERLKINPDNIATPIAAALGDITTLGILSVLASWFYRDYHTAWWFFGPALCLVVVWVLLPLWLHVAWNSKETQSVLVHGWTPVLCAMLISSGAGSILERILSSEAKYFQGVAVFQPVINGVAGNLVAVQASRIGTFLHRFWKVPGRVPPGYQLCTSVADVFFSRDKLFGIHSRSALVLLGLVVPGHLIFLLTISLLDAGHSTITPRFMLFYLTAAVLQVAILLYITHVLSFYLWKIGQDPDTTSIPYLTALGDLTGTSFLALAFYLLYLVGDRDLDVGD